MNSINGSDSFQPLTQITQSLSDSVKSLEKFMLFPHSKLTELNVKLQNLPAQIQSLQDSGYTLSNDDIAHLKGLSERILAVLQPNKKFPTLQKILQVINPKIAVDIDPLKTEIKNSASLAGLLALSGREEDSLDIIKNLPDEASRIQGYADLIKAGSISLVSEQAENMTENELTGLMKELNKKPSSYMKTALIQIPLSSLKSHGIDSGLKLACEIKDPKTRIKAYMQLANAGAMHQIIEIATKATPQKCNELLGSTDGENFLNELKNEFSKKETHKGGLIDEFVKSIDVGLEKIQEGKTPINPPTSPQITNPSGTIKASDSPPKSSTPFRSFRKTAALITGVTGFFSGKSTKPEPQISTQISNSALNPEGLPTPDDTVSKTALPLEDHSVTESISNEPVEVQEETLQPETSDLETLHNVSGLLKNILFSMIRGNEISNLDYKENTTYGIDAHFNLEKCEKPAPKDAITQLIRGVGNGQIPEDKIELSVKYLDITAHFPEEMSITTGMNRTDNGVDNYIKFTDPKKAISLDFSSEKSFIVRGLLSLAGLSGLVGVKEIIYEKGDYENVKIIFDKYDKKGWKDKPVEVNLGDNQEAAVDFWNLINTSP